MVKGKLVKQEKFLEFHIIKDRPITEGSIYSRNYGLNSILIRINSLSKERWMVTTPCS
jgi:hypothetical protein